MPINTETLRVAARAIDDAEKEAAAFRAGIPARYRLPMADADGIPFAHEGATFDQLVTEVEAGRALDALVENRKVELDALVNGKPKRKRAKKAEKKTRTSRNMGVS